jgi:hypothetical protein
VRNTSSSRIQVKQPRAAEAWEALEKHFPFDELKEVKDLLECLANQKPSFRWQPPQPRDARRFADSLRERVAPKVRRMNLYFNSTLPLGRRDIRDLPEIIEGYAQALASATKSRRKQRPTDDNQDREVQILRRLHQCGLDGREHHYYAQASTLIQAAYNAGNVNRTVNEVSSAGCTIGSRTATAQNMARKRAMQPTVYSA